MALTRRHFLLASAGALVLAACGGDDDGPAVSPTVGGGDVDTSGASLVRFFADGTLVAGVPQRLPLGLADSEGLLTTTAPETVVLEVFDADGRVVGEPVEVRRHDAGIPRPYFPAFLDLTEEGVYFLRTQFEGDPAETAFTLVGRSGTRVPLVGGPLPPVETPTVDDPRGVDPICTAEPQCPLHEVSLAQALGESRPVAFLIGTPAFCQTAICGPVLDLLVAQQQAFPEVRMVHAEVYTRPDPTSPTTPAIDDYALTFEPVLFVADASGVITDRFDGIWDADELVGALERVS